MAKTIAQLRSEAQTIKNETMVGANTATRVGGFGEDIVDYLDTEIDASFATGEAVGDITLFDDVADLDGKTSAEKKLLLPNGNAVETIIYKWRQMSASSLIYESVYVNSSGNWADGTSGNGNGGVFLSVSAGDEIKLVANGTLIYSVLKNNNHVIGQQASFATGYSGRVVVPVSGSTAEDTFVVPSDARYVYICTLSGGTSINVDIYRREEIMSVETRTIRPLFTFDYIGGVTGDFSTNKTNFENGKNIATPRFIKTSEKFTFRSDKAGTLQVYLYDEDFDFIQALVFTYSTANADFTFDYLIDYSYIKLVFQQSTAFVKSAITLTGVFGDDWDVFNAYPSDSGYHRISAMVNVSNPDSDNEEGSVVQDQATFLPNYGVIALPTTYTNNGEPTRLIIYCHGAGTHYGATVTRFSSDVIKPEYWLAEGYAIMDMDGQPFDATTNPAFIPQVIDCYEAGYKWAIEHYNLKRDGVFLGGRSMGAGNSIYMMRQQCRIPLVAVCANLPTSLSAGYTAASKAGRIFLAIHKGFVLPSGYSDWNSFPWGTSGQPSEAEIQLYIDNWGKYSSCVPILANTLDIPITDEWKRDLIMSTLDNAPSRIGVLSPLHAKAKVPLKMFACHQDPNNDIDKASGLYLTMFQNTANIVSLRLFNSYKDYTGTGYTAHYYELQDPALWVTATTIYGATVQDVPILYVEMLEFWRRYEQGM